MLSLFDVVDWVFVMVVEVCYDYFDVMFVVVDDVLWVIVYDSYWYVVCVLCIIYLFMLVCWVKVDVVWVCMLCDYVVIGVWFNSID